MGGPPATAPGLACAGQSKVCASEGTFVSSQPCRLLCQRLPAPTPWCTRHLLGSLVLATPGRALLLKPAKPPSGVPPDRLDPPLQPPLQRLSFPQALSHLCVSRHAVTSARRPFLLGKLTLLLQARPNLLGIVCWVLGCPPAWFWLGTSLSTGTRLAVCPGPGPSWWPPCCWWPSASPWP